MTAPQMLIVHYRARPIAMVFAEDARLTDSMAALLVSDPLRRFTRPMLAYAQAICRGQQVGPYTDTDAEAHARRSLLPDDLGPLLRYTNQEIAELFQIPVEQVAEHRLRCNADPARPNAASRGRK